VSQLPDKSLPAWLPVRKKLPDCCLAKTRFALKNFKNNNYFLGVHKEHKLNKNRNIETVVFIGPKLSKINLKLFLGVNNYRQLKTINPSY